MYNELFTNWDWQPPKDWKIIETIDLHTAGEPLRVVTRGLPVIDGDTILEKRSFFRKNYDSIRTGLMWEPRGHADMYGAIITPPVREDSDFGTFFLHNEGYSTMCGHAMIALVTLVVETGLLEREGEDICIKIDAPPGQIVANATVKNNRVEEVSFLNVPSFVLYHNREINVEGIGNFTFDVAYGGAFYAFVDASEIGLRLEADNYAQVIDWGRRIKLAIIDEFEITHPFEADLSFLYGTIFIDEPHDANHHSRNACVFADGELDRSPTGSGVSARAAIHALKDGLEIGQSITIESILDTLMDVEIDRKCTYGNYSAVVPRVSGKASITGKSVFYFDPKDQLKDGFIFR